MSDKAPEVESPEVEQPSDSRSRFERLAGGARQSAVQLWRVVPWVVVIFALHYFLIGELTGQPTDDKAPGDSTPADTGKGDSGNGDPGAASDDSSGGSDTQTTGSSPGTTPDQNPGLSPAARARFPRPTRLELSNVEEIVALEDPVTLYAVGRDLLSDGKDELARAAFEAAVEKEELNLYEEFAGTRFGEAVVEEHMGNLDEARKIWRSTFYDDVITAYFFINRYSIDSEKETLLREAADYARKLASQAKAGQQPHFYTTSKGASRPLAYMTMEEAMLAFQAGERLRYVYIEHLDLTNQVFPNRVGCKRCIVGKLEGYGSEFQEQFDLHAMVLEEAHLGKKWTGEINKSKPIAPASFNRLYLGDSVFLNGLNLDSIKITGRIMNLPKMTVRGELDLRNAELNGVSEFRYASATGKVNFRGAQIRDAVYFGHTRMGELNFSRVQVHNSPLLFDSARFTGPVTLERCELHRGATFENATFFGDVIFRQCDVTDRLNLSRAHFLADLDVTFVQAEDIDALGIEVVGNARFADSVFTGNVRFALDSLTRRLHLDNVDPLHPLYKQYQGDVDAEENLTDGAQYGVVTVDDLTATFLGDVSFANTIFQKFVSFEGVRFGSRGESNESSFYNAQFYGEAHFERTEFYSAADFRTISGIEIGFNDATFHNTWILDDANVPGRLTTSGVEMVDDATLSFYGARMTSFNITFAQLRKDEDQHRLFYEQCFLNGLDNDHVAADPRLLDARWDAEAEEEITDEEEIALNIRKLCGDRTIAEFVLLKDSFNKRSMAQESDWAYWHLRHYKNEQLLVESDSFGTTLYGYVQWLIFEKAFGWGVRLSNLLGTGLVVILFYMFLLRFLCQNMLVNWDGKALYFRDLPVHGWFVISFHSFLGRARDWRAQETNPAWKVLYTSEMIIGIILITFFIGAYTRMVLR